MRAPVISLLIVANILVACAPVMLPSPTSPPAVPPTKELVTSAPIPPTVAPLPQPATAAVEASPDSRSAIFPKTIIVYQRQGGSTSSLQQWTFYRTGRIVTADGKERQALATEVEPLFLLAESPDYWKLNDNYVPDSTCHDCVVHILTVYRAGETKKVTATQGADWPLNLKQILGKIDGLITR